MLSYRRETALQGALFLANLFVDVLRVNNQIFCLGLLRYMYVQF